MKEHPIIFTGEMVRAILEGRKTQTRRVIKPQPECVFRGVPMRHKTYDWPIPCPYGIPGDRLWVRETWCLGDHDGRYDEPPEDGRPREHNSGDGRKCFYRATEPGCDGPWRPSIFMPRWASRITLENEAVRVERLQDITLGDVLAEGFDHPEFPEHLRTSSVALGADREWKDIAFNWWISLWDSINGKRDPWESNPWVWVPEWPPFKRIAP